MLLLLSNIFIVSYSASSHAHDKKSVSEDNVQPRINSVLPDLLAHFKPEDILNADETGLFYNLQPDRTLAFKGEKCSGGKKSKERRTVLVCASMAGEKGPMLVIGKSKTPRCFAGVKSLPLPYQGNSKAWMTADIFEDYLKKWNWRLAQQNGHILLVVDNCRAHPHLVLSNITLKFLPPNTTAKLQPCDQGIIQSLKVHYKCILVRRLLIAMDSGVELRITVLDVIKWLEQSWSKVTDSTIRNYFKHCGFVSSNVSSSDEPQSYVPTLEPLYMQLQQRGTTLDRWNHNGL